MSIEESLESIANSLEILADTLKTKTDTPVPPPPPVVTGGQDLLPTSPGGRKGGRKKAEPASTVAPTTTPAAQPEVSMVDIRTVLQSFLKKFPGPEGAEKARVFFSNAGAKNITTLDPTKYKEVFLGLSEAAK